MALITSTVQNVDAAKLKADIENAGSYLVYSITTTPTGVNVAVYTSTGTELSEVQINAIQTIVDSHQSLQRKRIIVKDNPVSVDEAANFEFVNSVVDEAISDLVASAPGTLDTLNELAAALGNDANFATTITNQIDNIETVNDNFNTRLSTVESSSVTLASAIQTEIVERTSAIAAETLARETAIAAETFGREANDAATLSSAQLYTDTAISQLAPVAVSGSYNDLIDVPTFLGLENGSSSSPSLYFKNTPNTGIFSPATNYIGFATAGTESLRITNTGRVGIGTDSPSTPLHVGGTTNKSFRIDSATNSGFFGVYNNASIISTNRDPAIGTFVDSTKAAAEINVVANAGDGYISFHTTSSNNTLPSEKMRITNAGRVGIGISSPRTKLHIGGAIPAETGYATYPGTLQIDERGVTSLTMPGGLEFQGSASSNGYGSKIVGFDDGSLVFAGRSYSAAWTERMRIDNVGRVGIGTTSPAENLHIRSSAPRIRFEDTDGASSSISGNAGGLVLQSDPSNSVASSFIGFDVDGVPRANINSSGTLATSTLATQNTISVGAYNTSNKGIWFVPDLGAGGYNYTSQSGDQGIFFTSGAQNTGNLVIAPHATNTGGLRIASDGIVNIPYLTAGGITVNNGNLRVYNSADYYQQRITIGIEEHHGDLLTVGATLGYSGLRVRYAASDWNSNPGFLMSGYVNNVVAPSGATIGIVDGYATIGKISGSSLRYKHQIEFVEPQYTERLYDLIPRWFRWKNDPNSQYSYWGFIAEEVAEIDPRMVGWDYKQEDLENVEVTDEDGNKRIEKLPKEGTQKVPDSVFYDRFVVWLVAVAQKHKATIDTQAQKIESLEKRLVILESLVLNKE